MKNWLLIIAILVAGPGSTQVGLGTSTPHNSSILHLNSTTKGLLIPRMNTTDRTGIASPANGLMVYDTDVNQFYFYNGTAWVQSIGPAGTNGTNGTNGNTILNGNVAPTPGIGVNGDFYLRTSNYTIYGPKSAGGWPAPVSLVGPAGNVGPQGPAGPPGPVNAISLTSENSTGLIILQGAWTMFPMTQMTIQTSGVIVNLTASLRMSVANAEVYCNLCYSASGVPGTIGTPILTAGGSANMIPLQLIVTATRTVTLNGIVKPPTAGVYWIGPCFNSPSDLLLFGVLGYAILL